MLRRVLVVLILLLCCASRAYADHSGYVAVPKGPGPHPAVVVIHEWWGLHPWVKGQADRLAAQGYVALAIDLYHGKLAKDSDEAHQLSRGLPRDRAMRELRAAVDYLAKRDDVKKDRIGCIGWCMGGGYAIELAIAEPRVTACVVAYGHLPTEGLKALQGPVLGIFGTDDKGIPPADVRAFWAAMSDAGEALELHEMLGVGHAFMNPNNQKGYDAGAADVATRAIDGFFNRTLKK